MLLVMERPPQLAPMSPVPPLILPNGWLPFQTVDSRSPSLSPLTTSLSSSLSPKLTTDNYFHPLLVGQRRTSLPTQIPNPNSYFLPLGYPQFTSPLSSSPVPSSVNQPPLSLEYPVPTRGRSSSFSTFLSPVSINKPQDNSKIRKARREKKKGRPRYDHSHMKCVECGATETPEWRSGPLGAHTLCNKCGLARKRKTEQISPATKPSNTTSSSLVTPANLTASCSQECITSQNEEKEQEKEKEEKGKASTIPTNTNQQSVSPIVIAPSPPPCHTIVLKQEPQPNNVDEKSDCDSAEPKRMSLSFVLN